MQVIYKYQLESTGDDNLDYDCLDKGNETFGIGGNT